MQRQVIESLMVKQYPLPIESGPNESVYEDMQQDIYLFRRVVNDAEVMLISNVYLTAADSFCCSV